MEKQKKARNRLTKAQSTTVCEVFAQNDGNWEKVSILRRDSTHL
jgi:hypothetical protein